MLDGGDTTGDRPRRGAGRARECWPDPEPVPGVATSPHRDRGQAFTLEAIVAGAVILAALLFALQVTGVTSLTASTSSQGVVAQERAVAAGTLDAAAANDTIRPTLLYWNETGGTFHGSEANETYYTTAPPTAFGGVLSETLEDRNLAYNVNVLSVENGTVQRTAVVRNGVPSDDAARATRIVTLYDDDRLLAANGTRTNTTLSGASFYTTDQYPGGPVYSVVVVEVVVWQV